MYVLVFFYLLSQPLPQYRLVLKCGGATSSATCILSGEPTVAQGTRSFSKSIKSTCSHRKIQVNEDTDRTNWLSRAYVHSPSLPLTSEILTFFAPFLGRPLQHKKNLQLRSSSIVVSGERLETRDSTKACETTRVPRCRQVCQSLADLLNRLPIAHATCHIYSLDRYHGAARWRGSQLRTPLHSFRQASRLGHT